MGYKLISATTILVLIIVVSLMFIIEIPLCYSNGQPQIKEPFVLYDTEIVDVISREIEVAPLYYIRILGESMSPSISNGDTCVCTPQDNYNKGDIISFYIPVEDKVELIAHRIATENNDEFITKGDSNQVEDPWMITEDQIFCKIPEKNLFNKLKFAIVESGGRFGVFNIVG